VLFWTTPTVYSWELVQGAIGETAQSIYLSNPVAVAVLGMQRAFWVAGDGTPSPPDLATRLFVMLGIGIRAALGGAPRVHPARGRLRPGAVT
jgi:ABC-2 type transport system permease protein